MSVNLSVSAQKKCINYIDAGCSPVLSVVVQFNAMLNHRDSDGVSADCRVDAVESLGRDRKYV